MRRTKRTEHEYKIQNKNESMKLHNAAEEESERSRMGR